MLGLSDLLCPELCAGCGRLARGGLCLACSRRLERLGPYVCACCGRPGPRPTRTCRDCRGARPHFDLARQAVEFSPVVRKAIHRFKYSGCRSLAVPLAGLIGEILDAAPATGAVTWVAPSPERLRRTGTDHGAVLAALVGRALGRPAIPMLQRVRLTRPQIGLDPASRRTNLNRAFGAIICPPAEVLVIDDVFTTGSTASEAARALKAAGAEVVVVFGVARSFIRDPSDL